MTTPTSPSSPVRPVPEEAIAAVRRALARAEPEEATTAALAEAGFGDPARALANLRRLGEALPGDVPESVIGPLLSAAAGSPDPDMALNNLERVLLGCEERTKLAEAWAESPKTLSSLAQLCACSQLLADILVEMGQESWRLVAEGAETAARSAEELGTAARSALATAGSRAARLSALRRFKRRELLRIAARDIRQAASFGELVSEVSDLALVCLQVVLELCREAVRPPALAEEHAAPADWARRFAVIAMGKLGGHELNYSSDVDLLFVHDASWAETEGTPEPVRRYFTALATALIEALGSLTSDGALFRVDLRLRPEGGAGSLVRSLASYAAYYESWGSAWERQALIKASWAAGDEELAARFLRLAEGFVYGKRLETEGVAEIKSVKARVEASARRGEAEADVKLSPGGIRDIEFTVQLLQLIFGTQDERVRAKSTLGALRALAEGGYLSDTERRTLASAYVFLRTVEHQLQLMHGLSTRQLPAEEAALDRLARRLGLCPQPGATPATLLLSEYRRHTASVRALFDKLFAGMFEVRDETDMRVRSLILSREGFSTADGAVLGEYGLRDGAQAATVLRRLAHGAFPAALPASAAERFADLAPTVLQAAARTPDPDASLANLEAFCGLIGSHGALYDVLAERPKTVGMLVRVAGCSASLSAILTRYPEYFDMLMDAGVMGAPHSPEEVADDVAERLAGIADPEVRLQAVFRFRRRELLRIGVRDLVGDADLETTLGELTALAEVCLGQVLDAACRKLAGSPAEGVPLAIIGLGKLGGREMHYNSDLDVMFVYRGGGDPRLLQAIAGEVLNQGGASSGVGPPLTIDARLRPEGQSGPLVRSVEACAAYYSRWAESWERLALVRARPVAGDVAAGGAFREVVAPFLWGHGLTAEELGAITHAKGRIERERAQTGEGVVDVKLGPGGINDIEFCVQLLQLGHGHAVPEVRVPGTLAGLRALCAAGLMAEEDGRRLEAAYLFLRLVESRLQIMHDWQQSAISAQEGDHAKVARLLEYEGEEPGAGERFAEDLHEHRTAAREVLEQTVARLAEGHGSGTG